MSASRSPVPVRVKICGLRAPEDARVAAEAGADLIGLVFTDSPRRVDIDTARSIASNLGAPAAAMAGASSPQAAGFNPQVASTRFAHQRLDAMLAERRPLVVGVFGDEPVEEIARIAEEVGLDAIQLSGRGAAGQAAALAGLALLVAFRSGAGASIDDVPAYALPLLDAPHATKLGGTGLRVDAALAARCASMRPVVLAGGLTPENVAEAIAAVRPWGVDVSSGVETDGAKDHDKIRAFVAAAKGVQPGYPDGISRSERERTDRPSGLSATNLPNRRSSPRLKTFDYMGPYAYSLSISTFGYRPLLKDERTVLESLEVLAEAATHHAVIVHAYCFMPNHLHLLVQGSESSSLIAFAKRFKQRSAYFYKRRTGQGLWHRSYYDHVLRREEDLRVAAQYVWNNPVQAGLARAPEEYPYSGPADVLGRAGPDRPEGPSVRLQAARHRGRA